MTYVALLGSAGAFFGFNMKYAMVNPTTAYVALAHWNDETIMKLANRMEIYSKVFCDIRWLVLGQYPDWNIWQNL